MASQPVDEIPQRLLKKENFSYLVKMVTVLESDLDKDLEEAKTP
jgi:hypothetical protein